MSIEQNISQFVQSQFPQFYRSEGPNFVAFVEAYYEWMEQNFQWMNVETTSGFSVGDSIEQEQSDDVIATGTIFSIEDDYMLVKVTSFAPFRCETRCNVLADVVNESGAATKIIEQSKVNPNYGARNLLKFRDVDSTVETFILHFKEKYLKNIQFNIATNKQLLIKNSLDLYRSKGTERSIYLFFKLVYDKNAKVYYPGDDIFKLSSGDWFIPRYLEISHTDRSVDLVGKTIYGLTSGASAFVEKFIKRKTETGYSHVLYISNVVGNFQKNEALRTNTIYADTPKVIGSLHQLTVINPGSSYAIGDIVDLEDDTGVFGKARVANVSTTTGIVEFLFNSGGYGYTTDPDTYVSDKILTIANVTTTSANYFELFENFSQNLANVTFLNISSNSISVGSNLYSYYANGSLKAQGVVLDANMENVVGVTVNTAANSTTLIKVTTGNTDNISVGDLVVGSTNTAVVNTNVSSKVTSIVNSTAFEVNTDITIANGTASLATSSVGVVGEVYVYVTTGTFESTNSIYTASNTISGTIDVVLDKSVYAKVIYPVEDFLLLVSNSTGTFSNGAVVFQSNGSATVAEGVITDFNISGGSGFISLSEVNGVFDTSEALQANGDTGICNIDSFTTTIEIQFNREKNVVVTTNTAANSTTLLSLTSGNTARIQPGDQLLLSSNTSVVDHNVGAFVESVVNSSAIVMDSDVIIANGSATLTFYDITDNDLEANTSIFSTTESTNTTFVIESISLGSDADYSIVSVETDEEVFINTDMVGGNNSSNVAYVALGINASAYGFPKAPTANLSSILIQALDFELMQIGTISDVITSNPGQDYTVAPKATIVEPAVAALNLKDYILTIEEEPGTIKVGDIITQNVGDLTQKILTVSNASLFIVGEVVYQGANLASSTANGIVYYANTASNKLALVDHAGTFANSANVFSHITGSNSLVSNVQTGNTTSKIARGRVTDAILGSSNTTLYVSRTSIPTFTLSGNTLSNQDTVTANILFVEEQTDSIQIGLNANVEANVVSSDNSVSELEVVDSGFGYVNNSIVTFNGRNGQTSGTAKVTVDSYGTGEGRYRDSNGFLSENKYLFDGDYYQEYSYEVISSLSFDKYVEMFKKVMHVAGTALYGSVEVQDVNSVIVNDNLLEVSS